MEKEKIMRKFDLLIVERWHDRGEFAWKPLGGHRLLLSRGCARTRRPPTEECKRGPPLLPWISGDRKAEVWGARPRSSPPESLKEGSRRGGL